MTDRHHSFFFIALSLIGFFGAWTGFIIAYGPILGGILGVIPALAIGVAAGLMWPLSLAGLILLMINLALNVW